MKNRVGPYEARIINGEKVISYAGNKQFSKIENVKLAQFNNGVINSRLNDIASNEYFYHLHQVDNSIFLPPLNILRKLGQSGAIFL